jgi:hypothetical protein
MTFDDQLKRALDTLTERVRDEIDRQVRAAMDELSTSARQEADAAAAAALAAIPAPAPAAIAAPPPHSVDADQRLLEGIRAIDAARSLTDILDALVGAIAGDEAGAGVWLARGGRLHHWRSSGLEQPDEQLALDTPRAIAEAAHQNAPASADGFAAPLSIGGQVIAVVYTGPRSQAGGDASTMRPQSVEILARHAAKCLESLTAFKTARAMADRAAADATAPRAADPGEEHLAAQRYARLLVSEIKLYHEQEVIEGRRDRDLATRLGGEIARARVMYEARVAPHVRERTDHFHDELVRTLAGGDPSLLELRT